MNLKAPIRDPYKITLRFNAPYSAWIAKLLGHSKHDGIDFACPVGTKVWPASIKGEWICRVGTDLDGLSYICSYVLTENKDVFFLLYRHLQNVIVKPGDFIINLPMAEVGDYELGSHCHFQVNAAVDPAQFLS